MKKLAAAAALTLVVPLGSCGGGGEKDVKGTVTIAGKVGASGEIATDGSATDGAACHGTNGYDDIAQGADLVVHDDALNVIGSTTLGTGKLVEYADLGGGTAVAKCVFDYSVTDVEGATERGNSVTVGHKRKGPAFDKGELTGGHADIKIGSMA